MVNEGKHLTREGLIKIAGIKACMNRGLSLALSEHFPTAIISQRPHVEVQKFLDPNWLVGFTCAVPKGR